MKLIKPLIFTGFLSLPAIISGAALPEAVAEPAALAVPEPYTGTTALSKREVNGANCWRYKDANASYWRLQTWGPWDQDWGKGLYDNLYGQCGFLSGGISEWSFSFEAGTPPTDGKASFKLIRDAYDDRCVQDAVWLASNGAGGGGGAINGMVCWESDKWW